MKKTIKTLPFFQTISTTLNSTEPTSVNIQDVNSTYPTQKKEVKNKLNLTEEEKEHLQKLSPKEKKNYLLSKRL